VAVEPRTYRAEYGQTAGPVFYCTRPFGFEHLWDSELAVEAVASR
jgi:hypothetical protein